MTGTYLRSDGGNAIRLAKAIKVVADKAISPGDGTPHGFRVSEIAKHCDLNAMQIGRLCSSHFTRPLVEDEVRRRYLRFVRYESRDDGKYIVVEQQL